MLIIIPCFVCLILQGALMSFSNWHSKTRAPCGAKSGKRTYECLRHPVLKLPFTAINLRPLDLLKNEKTNVLQMQPKQSRT